MVHVFGPSYGSFHSQVCHFLSASWLSRLAVVLLRFTRAANSVQ